MPTLKLLIIIALFSVFPPVAQAETLMEIYQLALEKDPLMREAEANRMATLESKPQALSQLLPQINFSGSRENQQQDGISTFPQRNAQGVVEVFTNLQDDDTDRTSLTLNVRQTLFQWDRWVALKQADKRVAQAEADFAAARQDLMLRVAQQYFGVLGAIDALESSQAAKESFARQLEQDEKRFEVGLIAITDVQEAQAAYDQSVADEIAAKRTLATAKENLREITGGPVTNLATLQDTLVLAGPSPANEEEWVSRAMQGNLALEASRLAAEIAMDDIDSRRANRYPTLELVASHNEFDSESDQINQILPAPPQASSPENDFSTTTIGIELRFPIYTGGFNTSRVREAVYLHRASKERAERIARQTERQTRDSYLGVLSEISRVNALKRAVESQQTALKATEAGLEVGTRTTVDVLISRQAYYNALTNYARSRYDYLLEVLRLKQAAGTLGEADLDDIEQWLK